ncbi:DMT family transporter [Clostridium sp. MSJ-4]|uniref:DMT family transporter n=1 Tax=Clostridium simiarum TaxID=2841506 RepID=A0ABS6F3S9_9CLOT|nr:MULTISPECIES: DMT family transporter [Clostridium]MBU5592520.1 DMT family transporter [Clostridium simiarum]
MEVNNKSSRMGTGYALISGVTWGIDTVLIGVILTMTSFVETEKAILLAPFISTFLHDLFSSIWVSIYHITRGEFQGVLKALKTRSGRFIMLGALLGGPLGMTCYMLSVKYIGASYAASITSIYPAIGAFFAFIFLKEKLGKRECMGILLSISGVIVLGYQPSEFTVGGSFLLGILFALGTILGWGLESVICAYGMKEDVTAEQALNIRQLTSAIFYGAIILPIIGGSGIALDVVLSKSVLALILTALVGTTSYMFYYKAINTIGAAKSTSLNITYAIWAIIIQVLFLKAPVSPQLILGCLITFTGTVLVSGSPREMLGLQSN